MSRVRGVTRLAVHVVDEQSVGGGQKGHSRIGLVLGGIPHNLSGLLHTHIARDSVCSTVQAARRDDIDGGGSHREGSVVPGKRHKLADFVVGRGAGGRCKHGDTTRRHARVDRDRGGGIAGVGRFAGGSARLRGGLLAGLSTLGVGGRVGCGVGFRCGLTRRRRGTGSRAVSGGSF